MILALMPSCRKKNHTPESTDSKPENHSPRFQPWERKIFTIQIPKVETLGYNKNPLINDSECGVSCVILPSSG